MSDGSALLDRFLLALCIWREARGEPFHGKELVAWTIVNRSLDAKNRWPKTVTGVILQPKQFSSFNADDPNAVQFPTSSAGLSSWNECVTVADGILGKLPPIPVNHYHVVGLLPAWRDESKIVTTEGAHVFYNL